MSGSGSRLSTQEQVAMCAVAQGRLAGDRAAAEERLLRQYEGLCKRLASRVSFLIDYEDALQEGRIAAIRAFRTFDETRGSQVSTYVYNAITNALRRALQRTSSTIALPAYVFNDLRRLDFAEDAERSRHNRAPTDEELVLATGLPEATVHNRHRVPRHRLSLDTPIPGADGKSLALADFIPDDAPLPEDATVNLDEWRQTLAPALRRLTPRQREVVCRRYGLPPYDWPQTLREAAAHMDMTPQAVHNCELGALRVMRIVLGVEAPEADAA